jgi:DtxR family Mn-dependent transcriptional regulator
MVSDIAEQYLKIIYNLTEDGGQAKTSEIAKAMGVAPASATEMVQKLSKQGYVSHERYHGTTLRPKGLKIARQVTRKHRLLERFLNDFCGIRGRSRHDQACKMEHVLTDEAERQLCRMMNRPSECPHGKQIPKCERGIACEKCTNESVNLLDLREGDVATVSHLASTSKEELCRILAMGFVPGSEVRIEKKVPMGGPIIVSVKGTKIALAREIGGVLHMMRAS